MGVDFELPTVKNYVFKLLLFPELFFKIFIMFLAAAGIVLMVEFGFNEFSPTLFCNEDGAAFRFCLNSIACNAVVIVVSAFLIFVDLLRACLTNKQWKRLVALLVIIIAIPLSAYLLASSSLVLRNYTTVCDERTCSNAEERRFLAIPIIGFVSSIFYLIVCFLSFLRLILSSDDY